MMLRQKLKLATTNQKVKTVAQLVTVATVVTKLATVALV